MNQTILNAFKINGSEFLGQFGVIFDKLIFIYQDWTKYGPKRPKINQKDQKLTKNGPKMVQIWKKGPNKDQKRTQTGPKPDPNRTINRPKTDKVKKIAII